jgi:ribosomal protein S3
MDSARQAGTWTRIPRAAGIATIAIWGELDQVRIDIQASRPGVAFGHGHAEFDRLVAELEELTGKPVQMHFVKQSGPPKGRKEIQIGPGV